MPRPEKSRPVEVLGVPIDYGSSRRGVAMGPMAFRLAGLVPRIEAEGMEVVDLGDVAVPTSCEGSGAHGSVPEIRTVCSSVSERVQETLSRKGLPVIVGGDHSIAIGTLAGVSKFYRSGKRPFGTLWVDAHGDMNNETTSPSGNVHGMSLAVSLGDGIRELVELGGFEPKVEAARTALVGIRNLDEKEREIIAGFGVNVFTMKDIDRRGVANVMEEALHVVSRGTGGVHVSFDMDVVDPGVAPGVGTPVAGGLSYREAHLVMESIHDSGAMTSLEIVEANPFLDVRNATARLGVELVLSALGKSIY